MSSFSFDSVLSIVGALVPLFSALASFLNHIVRVQTGEGKTPATALLAVGTVLNAGALNIDKSVQLVKMARALGGKADEAPAEEKQE